jgi:hypothetical protein
VSVILTEVFGASTSGIFRPLTVNPAPDVWTCEKIAPSTAEVLVRLTELVFLLPTATLPKSTVEALRLKFAGRALVRGIPVPQEMLAAAAKTAAIAPSQLRRSDAGYLI